MAVQEVIILRGAWYGDGEERLKFAEGSEVEVANPAKEGAVKPLGEDEIGGCLSEAIGSERIWELGRGKERVVIVIDDLTRLTPTDRFPFLLLEELRRGGDRYAEGHKSGRDREPSFYDPS